MCLLFKFSIKLCQSTVLPAASKRVPTLTRWRDAAVLRNILGSGLSAFWLTLSAELLPIFVSASQNTVRCQLNLKIELTIPHAKAAHQASIPNEDCSICKASEGPIKEVCSLCQGGRCRPTCDVIHLEVDTLAAREQNVLSASSAFSETAILFPRQQPQNRSKQNDCHRICSLGLREL